MRRAILGLVLLAASCADEPVAPQAPRVVDSVPIAAPGDPLLARARRSISADGLSPDVRAEITASDAAVHARARRLLAALDDAQAGQGAASSASTPVVPRLPTTDANDDAAAPTPVPSAAAPTPANAPTPARAPATSTRATLERVALAPTRTGGVLTIQADAGVLVGVASQPSSSVVRLVLDGVAAVPKVLSARPQIPGARVSAIDRGPSSVRITLELDDGWRFAGVRRTGRGAKVDLVGP